jgi:hypothetical protein
MKINYGLTGKERKVLVTAISGVLNTPAKYLGIPSYGYQIGEYNINREGLLAGPYNSTLVENFKQIHGLTAVSEDYYEDAPETEETIEAEETPAFEALNLTEREELGLGKERRDHFGENGPQASDVPDFESRTYQAEFNDPEYPDRMEVFGAEDDEDAIQQAYTYATGEVVLLELKELDDEYNLIRSIELPPNPYRLTIEVSLDGFNPEKLENLTKLVTAKAPLLKAALCVNELPIKLTENSILFPWFWEEHILTAEEVTAFSTLVSLLCKTAIEKKRVTAKEKAVDENPKYAFRCFLLSLGCIGDEYKISRRILLSRLEGNGSWKNGKKAEAEAEPIEA